MVGMVDNEKVELLTRAARVAASSHASTGLDKRGLFFFLRHYYQHVVAEDLLGRDPLQVSGAALSHYDLATTRPRGTAQVRVFNPTVERNGWVTSQTVVEIVTDDMPFLVDSATMELSRQGCAIHGVIHPQLVVSRDITGALTQVSGSAEEDQAPAGAMVESWMYIEIDREPDPVQLRQIETKLRLVLRNVRDVAEDWRKIRGAALGIADELAADSASWPEHEVSEAGELLRWLADEHFIFLGYREYTEQRQDGQRLLDSAPGTGLGILRGDQSGSLFFRDLSDSADQSAASSPDTLSVLGDDRLLVLTKANARSTVHRSRYLDYVAVKKRNPNGVVVSERRFLGLFSYRAYTESVTRIPGLRRKVCEVLEATGFPAGGHSGKAVLEILETYPQDELFQIATADLTPIVLSVLHLRERRRVRLFLRPDSYGCYFSALVYLPRDRYTTSVRLRIQQILLEELQGATVEYTVRVSESVLARLYFIVRGRSVDHLDDVDADRIEQRLAAAVRSWGDDLADALAEAYGSERGAQLYSRYGNAIPEGYKEDFSPRVAVADLERMAGLQSSGNFAMRLYELDSMQPGSRRFKIYRAGPSLSLSEVLPILQGMGVEVMDERPYEFRRPNDTSTWIYDFGLQYSPAPEAVADSQDPETAPELFQDAFAAIWSGEAESDGFNALVLRAGLTWRQVALVRAYAAHLRQGDSIFSQVYIEQCLSSNAYIARLLVQLFEARVNPAYAQAGPEVTDGFEEEIIAALDAVVSLDDDRILRSLLNRVKATLRTNYFQRDVEGNLKPYLAIKFDARVISNLPLPRPDYEIWVYSPRVEGVHLRFGAVARGGLRWSDRREDFRTEILGLAKAQMVKNAVIVPVGAKGGFVVKQIADAADREATMAEGIACYRTFIRGLLDVTDNLVGDRTVVPPDVIRYDGDDPYLVVAADKGTASFSDIANGVAAEYRFWLGDAFASGGSAGYDHKAMGITARGAWESVKRHFQELGHDTQTQDFTVIGIGDMSGDVFGNGMLLSRHIRLLAAFDHRHIFLDPDPDPRVSYTERARLAGLPLSSWADYNPDLISTGGGVYPRAAKSISVTSQVRAALGIADGVMRMTPAELIKAIVMAPADLLFNGGIGTFIKSAAESHAAVGDKINDAIRVDSDQLRVKVIGEGGNLGCTQLGRVEFALAGGKVNTDAIDNSAGVDCSDHEVNIKILLNAVVARGEMEEEERAALLAAMTDEVAELVLRDNYNQNVALSNAVAEAASLLHVDARYIRHLERAGQLDRELEYLPSDRQIAQRRQAGLGLTQPELAVLLAYTKITLAEELLASTFPEDPYLRKELYEYFPTPLRERFAEHIYDHSLRREIITTRAVNNLVNNAGSTSVFRLREETGASIEDITRTHIVAAVVYGLRGHVAGIQVLDTTVSAEARTRMRLEGQKLIERASRWLLAHRRSPLDIASQVDFFASGVADVVAHLPKLLQGSDLSAMERVREELAQHGVPDDLATAVASMPSAFAALDIVGVAQESDHSVIDVAEVYFDLADRLQLTSLLRRIVALPRTDRWKTIARAALRDDLYAAHAALTFDVLAIDEVRLTPGQRFAAWQERNAAVLARARQTLADIESGDVYDLATLSVAIRAIRTLLRSGSMP